jgi:hypothetical protein
MYRQVWNFKKIRQGKLKDGGMPDDFIMPFGKYFNKTYKYVCDIDTGYIKWLLDQKNIKRDHPFMFNYFLIFMKEHNKD